MKIDLNQLEFIEPLLREIALEVENRFGEKTLTSLFRIGDTGVHGQLPLRGLDFSCSTMEHGKEVMKFVNSMWTYDPVRPDKQCCKCHDVGTGLHLHLQVHPNTVEVNHV